MIDIYLWSIENRHTVRCESYGIRLEVACFSDAQVARNFRDWLADLDGLEDLLRWTAKTCLNRKDYILPDSTLVGDVGDTIIMRRRHKDQLWHSTTIEAERISTGAQE